MTLGAGPRGYADYQRVVNWDGPIFYSPALPTTREGNIELPERVSVDRYSHVAGLVGVETQPVEVRLEWFTAATGGTLIATRRLYLSPEIVQPAQLHIPNLGPWLMVKWVPEAGGPWKQRATLSLTNRVYPVELVPRGAYLLDELFGGPGEATRYLDEYYAGPVVVCMSNATNAASTASIEGVFPGVPYVWHIIGQVSAASGVTAQASFVIPPAACRLLVGGLGAGNASVTVTPSYSGAA